MLSVEEEAVIVAFRRSTLLPLHDCLYALQPTIPHLTRSSLHRCLQRHGIGRLPDVEGNKPAKRKFKAYPIGYFHIDVAYLEALRVDLVIERAHVIGCSLGGMIGAADTRSYSQRILSSGLLSTSPTAARITAPKC